MEHSQRGRSAYGIGCHYNHQTGSFGGTLSEGSGIGVDAAVWAPGTRKRAGNEAEIRRQQNGQAGHDGGVRREGQGGGGEGDSNMTKMRQQGGIPTRKEGKRPRMEQTGLREGRQGMQKRSRQISQDQTTGQQKERVGRHGPVSPMPQRREVGTRAYVRSTCNGPPGVSPWQPRTRG